VLTQRYTRVSEPGAEDMSSELEAGGALITAGLASTAIQDSEGRGHGEPGPCINCGAVITGKFCGNCGQPAHIHRSLLHLAEEALHGILHFDGRMWRTLPKLALRPGTLTHDYIVGRRARYVSPLAAFLFTIFLMFFVFSLTGGPNVASNPDPGLAGEIIRDVNADLADEGIAVRVPETGAPAEAAPAQPAEEPVSGPPETTAPEAAGEGGIAAAPSVGADGVIYDAQADGTWQEAWTRAVEDGHVNIGIGDAAQKEKIRKKLKNPDLLLYKFENTAYKFSFLLVPISLPFLALLFFWKKGVTLFDHGVFLLYSLTFASLLFVVMALLVKLPGSRIDGLAGALIYAMPVHMFFQLKGAYVLGWFSALWRTFFLLVAAILSLALFALFIIFFGLLG